MSSLSSNSSSLFDRSLLSSRSMASIRQSNTKVRERSVTCWTPVVIGNSNFPSHIAKVVHAYKTGDVLHSTTQRPKLKAELHGGLIIDMPLTDIKTYLES